MTHMIDLTKKVENSLIQKQIFGEKANVAVVLDKSISMDRLFDTGVVQKLTDRLLAIGMNMDSNDSIDLFTFGITASEAEPVTISNHDGYIANMMKSTRLEGGTYYATVMEKIIKKYTPKKGLFRAAKKADLPTFVLFITDGDNHDQPAAERLIRESSNQAIFWQFVGVGNAQFNFLRELDDMEGRFLDNADFFSVPDLSKISDEELYDKLLTEFPSWITQARAAGILQ